MEQALAVANRTTQKMTQSPPVIGIPEQVTGATFTIWLKRKQDMVCDLITIDVTPDIDYYAPQRLTYNVDTMTPVGDSETGMPQILESQLRLFINRNFDQIYDYWHEIEVDGNVIISRIKKI